MSVSGYILEPIREDDEFVLYRGRGRGTRTDKPDVLVLKPAAARPRLRSLNKLKHEYSLRDELLSEWAIRPLSLSQDDNGQATLVFECPGGEPLDRLVVGPMEMGQFLRISVGLATALMGLHKGGLIHKDLKPANVIVNPATFQVWLTGFGIASRLVRERQNATPLESIEGTLTYMAPEQTGRMNRSIDSRSDLYALGVILYEMVTGRLPFSASDSMEWMHCHIARQPAPPTELRRDLPPAVCAIILKLLAKTPEERYQTAAGVLSDLQRCLSVWSAQGRIVEFSVGEDDTPDRLLIPERLYGRAGEIETLINAFNRIVAGGRPELVLVSGYAGIGKSSVVNELHKALVPPRGLFAFGKFDQYKRHIPYATLAQAFESLVRLLLSKGEAELHIWRDALCEALGTNGLLMMDLVPDLRLIIGEQPPVPELPPKDAQHRFQLVVRRFIGVFARPEHPLVLFLDDLQWLDVATLDLLEDLLTQSDVSHLLLLGAYRDNEVEPSHPLISKLEMIRRAGATVREIVLEPLRCEDLEHLLADSLHCEVEYAAPLAQLVRAKTGGNPFFAIQFVSALAEEGLLAFDHDKRRWSWDLNEILAKGYTDNVVDLIVWKLNRLPSKTQEALQQLACLGNSAEFDLVEKIYQNSNEDIHDDLAEAIRAGVLFRSEHAYRFLHDRVQEAAYSLIPEDARGATHLRIGRLLVSRIKPADIEENIFEIVNQLNRGVCLVTSAAERTRIAELNLVAARRAKLSIAYASALSYLVTGRELLTENSWNTDYQLVFSIERLIAQCELLTADMESAERRLSTLASRANTAHDLALITCLQLTLYTALDRLDQGIEICLDYLRRDGMEWSAHPASDEVQREYDRIWSLLGNRQIENLVDESLVTDPDTLDVFEVLTELITPAVFFDHNLCAFVIFRLVNLSLEHGNTDASSFAYVWFAMISASRFGKYEDAVRFGQLGYDLLQKRGLKRFEARTCMCFGSIVVPVSRHFRQAGELVRHAFNVAYQTGDFTYAAYSLTQVVMNLLVVGDPLSQAQTEAEKGVEFAKKARVGLAADIIASDLQLIRTLRGLTKEFGSFDDQQFNEAEFERHLASNPAFAEAGFGYWILKTEARFFAGDYSSAIAASRKAHQKPWVTILEPASLVYYGALSHAALDCSLPDQQKDQIEALKASHRQLEVWAKHCPENFEDRAALVGAEIARIEGRVVEAEELYEKGIRSAHANGFIHNEAVAFEVAARFYAARGLDKIADSYLREARYCYLRWGADGKVKQLDELYPQLVKQVELPDPKNTIMAPVQLLDITTVISVSKAISGEINLEKLIDTVMRLAIQHAGAERGLLVLPRGTEYRIGAESTTNLGVPRVYLREGPVEAESLPRSILNYVVRTKKSLILDDASTPNEFSGDAYFIRHRARSLLCLPLLNQAELIGVLYLENKLTPRVFDGARVAVLQVIASQAAISLTNSYLYREQKQAETALRRSEAFLAEAQKLSHTGSCGWNVSNGELVWSEETYRIVGIAPATKPTLDLVWQIVHPEDRDIVR